jgi:diguanylate cyclase (GGDEF)-like protein
VSQLGQSTRKQRRVILAIGALVGCYLLLLSGAGLFGQERLREALARQTHLDLEKREAALRYFFAERRDDMATLALDRALDTFFANQALGMSMAYGLRASLEALRERLEQLQQLKRVGPIQVYRRVAFYLPDGEVLADSLGADVAGQAWAAPQQIVQLDRPRILLSPTPQGPRIHAAAPVRHKGRLVGMVVGEIDSKPALEALFAERHDSQGAAFVLYGPQGVLFPLGSQQRLAGLDAAQLQDGAKIAVRDTPLGLIAYGDVLPSEQYYTSPWFLAGLFLLALPVAGGVWHLLRLNTHNLVLRTRVEAAARQREALREHNAALQNEIAKRREYEQLLAKQANYDPLTSLPNRHLAFDRLSQAIKHARRERLRVLVMFADLDHFKLVNDSLGHAAGDQLLRDAAARLTSVLRDSDTVARLGGDEFLLIFPDVHSIDNAESLASTVLEVLRPPFEVEQQEFFIGASVGLAMCPDDGDTPEQLLKNADMALYRAKAEGRNRFHFFTPTMDSYAKQRLVMESHLRHAVEREELQLVFQPLVDLRHGRSVVAVEALLRWHNPELGSVSPADFIPLAEETGVIHELTDWVLRQACEAAGTWPSERPLRVAINISAKEFVFPERLLRKLQDLLADGRLAPERLELELTESLLMQANPAVATVLQHLDAHGVRLSIDDFGTGYSALSYLQRFPFDTLKIDRSFVQGVETEPASAALVRAIIGMAEALGLETVAEGVETEGQAAFLTGHGCRYAQGFLFSRPVSAGAIAALLQPGQAAAVHAGGQR